MTAKRIVFCTFGSLGDIYPFLALAQEMKRRGHSPVIATSPAYRGLIESENVAFHPVRPDLDVTDPEILRRVMDGLSFSVQLSAAALARIRRRVPEQQTK